MMNETKILVLTVAALLSACGAGQEGNQAKKNESAASAEASAEKADGADSAADGKAETTEAALPHAAAFALTDEEKDEVAAQVEEAMETVSEEVAQEDDSAGSLLIKRKVDARFSRQCDEKEDGSAVVTVDRSIDRSLEVAGADASASREKSRKLNLIRVWEKYDQPIRCHASGKFIDLLSVQGLDGLKISTDFSRGVSRDLKHSDGRFRSGDYEVYGERSILFSALNSEDKHILTATIESDLTRSYSRTTKDGEVILKSRIRTDEDNPLVLVAENSRNKLFRWPDSVEIASGKVILERANGTLVETTFDKVKVDFTNGLCQRRSGDITGSIKRADGSLQTYKVDFDEKNLLITFADGTEKRLESVRCVQ